MPRRAGKAKIQTPNKRATARLNNAVANVARYRDLIHQITTASKNHRRELLANAPLGLVKAYGTISALLKENNYKFKKGHENRARRLASPSVKLINKVHLVRGKPGTVSRGGGFFQDIGHAFHKMGDDIKHAAFTVGDDVKHAAYKTGDAVKHVAWHAGDELKDIGYEIGPDLKEGMTEAAKELAREGPKLAVKALVAAV